MRTARFATNNGKMQLWWQACRLQGWSMLQPTRLPLQKASGREPV
jgi:hypothetical protein